MERSEVKAGALCLSSFVCSLLLLLSWVGLLLPCWCSYQPLPMLDSGFLNLSTQTKACKQLLLAFQPLRYEPSQHTRVCAPSAHLVHTQVCVASAHLPLAYECVLPHAHLPLTCPFVFVLFEIGPHVAKAGPELSDYQRLVLNSVSSYLSLGLTGL